VSFIRIAECLQFCASLRRASKVGIQRHGNIWRDGFLHQNTPVALAKLRLLRITGVGDRVKRPVRFRPIEPIFSAGVRRCQLLAIAVFTDRHTRLPIHHVG